MRRFFAPNEKSVRAVLRGPHPIAVAGADVTDRLYGLALAGGAGGAVIIGEPASTSRKYSGELGPLQKFHGAAFMAASANMRSALNQSQAFPSTRGPLNADRSMVDLIGRTQIR